uniref:Uncharacterized protein n=1 Tax=Cacopsylla melanoneura TaxID=428564 RepID=A0A8D8VTU6_9HEMI
MSATLKRAWIILYSMWTAKWTLSNARRTRRPSNWNIFPASRLTQEVLDTETRDRSNKEAAVVNRNYSVAGQSLRLAADWMNAEGITKVQTDPSNPTTRPSTTWPAA